MYLCYWGVGEVGLELLMGRGRSRKAMGRKASEL